MVHWLGNSCLIPKLAWEVNPGYWGGLQVCICLCTFTLFVVEITKVNLWSWEYLQLACYVRLWVIGPRQYPLALVSFKDWICATVCLGVLTVVGGLSQRWLADFTDSDCYWWCWPLLFKQNGALSSGGAQRCRKLDEDSGFESPICCLHALSMSSKVLSWHLGSLLRSGRDRWLHAQIDWAKQKVWLWYPANVQSSQFNTWRKSNNW